MRSKSFAKMPQFQLEIDQLLLEIYAAVSDWCSPHLDAFIWFSANPLIWFSANPFILVMHKL